MRTMEVSGSDRSSFAGRVSVEVCAGQPVGQAAAADKSDRQLHFFLMHLEQCVGDDGFAVGGVPSLGVSVHHSCRLSVVPKR